MKALEIYNVARTNKEDESCCKFCDYLFSMSFKDRKEFLILMEFEGFETQKQLIEHLHKNF